MGKILWVILCMAFIPTAVLAQDLTLYEISNNMLTLTEETLSCMAAKNECSKAEALYLKADAEQGLQDIMSLLVSGNISRMKLSSSQTAALQVRLIRLRSELVHTSGLLQGACNYGIYLFSYGLEIMALGLYYLLGPILLKLEGISYLLLGILYLPVGCLLMLTCPFWWI